MHLTLKEEHQNHLRSLNTYSIQDLQELCEAATRFINFGTTSNSTAKELDIPPISASATLQALAYLAAESTRYQVSEEDLGVVLIGLGFPAELRGVLSLWIHFQISVLSLKSLQLTPARYNHLEWRFEATICSRSLHLHQGNSQVTFVLTLRNPAKKVVFQTTPSALRYLVSVLEVALSEAGSRHAKRALRAA